MALVTLAEMKQELNVFHDDEDTLITAKIDQCQAHLEALLGYDIATEFADPLVVPVDLIGAIKMLTAGSYENRESTLVGVIGMETPHASGKWFAIAANTVLTVRRTL